ncbi:MAG: SusC/RagA family TonB-linked outer membrane protein, partial [Prevotella sp.]|nr:SusC/RagA family TonB-linked outer membrane protein [Prevotella sp.]
MNFFYSENIINRKLTVSLDFNKASLADVLQSITAQTGLTFLRGKNTITVGLEQTEKTTDSQAASYIIIKGKIVDPAGEPLPGASIYQKGIKEGSSSSSTTSIGALTNSNGEFALNCMLGKYIYISYIGYTTQEILATQGNTLLHIQLSEDSEVMREVIVTALGIRREEKILGYSAQRIEGINLSSVKGLDVTSALTGKIAGLSIKNSTEFIEDPSISLRGYAPLLVVDGVPFYNVRLSDIPADDIESIDILKGSPPSSLYGYKGGNGTIMVTTKKASEEGLSVKVNSSTMFHAGYLKMPEVQHSYSAGSQGKYIAGDYVWGDKLDIGRTAKQYDPYNHEWSEMPLVSKGRNNLDNFLETAILTNNNVNISQKGRYGGARISLTHIYNKGQFPNSKFNRFSFSVSGNTKWKGITLEASSSYNKSFYPNNMGTGYGIGGYLYNTLIWTGSDYDIRDYRNYWRKKDKEQNWMDDNWYDNPYFLAYERTQSNQYDISRNYFDLSFNIIPSVKVSIRTGLDNYINKFERKEAISSRANKKGYYSTTSNSGYSLNNDVFIFSEHKIKDFTLNGFLGGSVYLHDIKRQSIATLNGLNIPGFYSIYASIDPPATSVDTEKQQNNSILASLDVGWKNGVFLQVTGRNDWVSTMSKSEQSYFYPSVSGSFIASEYINLPKPISFWKLRASWNLTKHPLGFYTINQTYNIHRNYWGNMTATSFPNSLKNTTIKPKTSSAYELGTSIHLLDNRLKLDFSYYRKKEYNLQWYAGMSHTSGYESRLVNNKEEQLSKGYEVVANYNVIRSKNWEWVTMLNWSLDRYYYHQLDPEFSTKRYWVTPGSNWYWISMNDWERDPDGNIIHYNGLPKASDYPTLAGYSNPDWTWGWTNTLRHKNVTLSFSLDGRVGGVMFNSMEARLWQSGRHIDSDNQWRYQEVVEGKKNYVGTGVKVVSGSVKYDLDGKILEDTRVFAPNDEEVSYESYMRLYNGGNRSNNLQDKTFFKLRELSLNYSFPKLICERLKVKEANVALIGQNLLIWTKDFRFSDPDIDR